MVASTPYPLNFIGNPPDVTAQCELSFQQNGILGLESYAAMILRAGDFTIFANTKVLLVNGGGGDYYSGYLSLARQGEHAQVINDIFVPMITQLYGGGSDPAECEDGEDNDGDGQVDFGQDPECANPSDDSESS